MALGRAGYSGAKRMREGYQYAVGNTSNSYSQGRVNSGKLPNEQGYNQTQWHEPIRGGKQFNYYRMMNRHAKNDIRKQRSVLAVFCCLLGISGCMKGDIVKASGSSDVHYNNNRVFDLMRLCTAKRSGTQAL